MSVFEKTLELLKSRPDYADILRRIVEYEKEHCKDQYFESLGWEYSDVRVDPERFDRQFKNPRKEAEKYKGGENTEVESEPG